MTYIEKIKQLLKKYMYNIKQYKVLKNIQSNIYILQNEIQILNIDTTELIDKTEFNNYLTMLITKYPTYKLVFSNCKIDELNVTLTKSALFENCEIMHLKLNQKNISSSIFDTCIFNFCKINQRIIINNSKIELSNCITKISNNKNCTFIIGNKDNSTVNIKNHNIENRNGKYFHININTNNLTLNNYNSPDCVELIINKICKIIDCIHIKNSTAVFMSNETMKSNMILIEDSTVKRLNTNSESIEILGSNNFNHVQVLSCEDFLINYDSSLNIKNTNINTKSLECSDNSEINDMTNKFKWLINTEKISIGKNFKLKYDNKIIYEKDNENYNDNEEIIEVIKNERKLR